MFLILFFLSRCAWAFIYFLFITVFAASLFVSFFYCRFFGFFVILLRLRFCLLPYLKCILNVSTRLANVQIIYFSLKNHDVFMFTLFFFSLLHNSWQRMILNSVYQKQKAVRNKICCTLLCEKTIWRSVFFASDLFYLVFVQRFQEIICRTEFARIIHEITWLFAISKTITEWMRSGSCYVVDLKMMRACVCVKDTELSVISISTFELKKMHLGFT